MDDEVNTRLAKAIAAFGQLNWNVWNQKGNQNQGIPSCFFFFTTHLYGFEMLTTSQQHIKKLNHFHTTCLRKIPCITWQKHILDTKVLTWGFSSQHLHHLDAITASLGQSCCPHEDHHLPKKLLYGELSQAKCSKGGQKKCFKDTLKVSMKSFGITPNCLEYLAQDRGKWHEVVKCGAKVCETRRNTATEQRRKLRKGIAISATATIIPCSHCPKLFHAQIGLINHLHTHRCLCQ